VDELWGERAPASAQHAVQVYVWGIRKVLRARGDRATVRTVGSGYVLEVDPELVDARRFERLVDEAQHVLADDPTRARGLFDEALGLWRGPPLAEFGQFEFACREADRLQDVYADAVEGLAEARLACGEHGGVGRLTDLVVADPLRERPRSLLMLALYRNGRHAEALEVYRDGREALDEIGLQPGPELRALEEAILRHDPSLAAPSGRTDEGAEALAADPSSVARPGSLPRVGEPVQGLRDGEDLSGWAPPRQTRKVVTAPFCEVRVRPRSGRSSIRRRCMA
jgi:DNA-binding SARP family transcriptional activator